MGMVGYDIYQTKNSQKQAMNNAMDLVFPKDESDYTDILTNFDPKASEVIGILSIDSLNVKLPIVEGTNEEELAQGVGHFIGTGFPGQERQILLSGHRDSVFKNLGKLKIGDDLQVQMSYGIYRYEIVETFIVDVDDTTVIDFTIDEEVLTLSTCYPFQFIGNAPQRYIISAKLVKRD